MSNKVIIVGSSGQDGTLLAEYLKKRDVEFIGLSRTSPTNILDFLQVEELIKKLQPKEIYYLAAYHHSSEEKTGNEIDLWNKSIQTHVNGLVNFLESIYLHSKKTKLVFASSSLIYSEAKTEFLNEMSELNPVGPYGVTKVAGMKACRTYRNHKGVFASNAILFNHESELRAEKFISKKIIKGAVAIQKGLQDSLVLGNLNSVVDWGAARDYVDAMVKILHHDKPEDFIIASGVKRTIRDFVTIAFGFLGLDWKKYVSENSDIVHRVVPAKIGDTKKLREATGWYPQTSFEELVRSMLIAEGGILENNRI
ncbi:MAG: GDP-mannose 4,6-dehydratase [Bacteriovoracaceae bacterium]